MFGERSDQEKAMKKRERFRGKAKQIKGKMGSFVGKVDHALKLGAFKPAKLDSLLQQMLSRLSILKNQRRLRCAHGRSDIAELLQSGHNDLALLRAEYVLNEQNMLEVFDELQIYCDQLIEKYAQLKHQKKCPNELQEPVASLIFASSECDELPELDDIRSCFSEKFGKDFVLSCIDMYDCNGAGMKLIEKLTARKEQSSESKIMLLKEVATEKGLKVDIDVSATEKLAHIVKEAKKFINNLNLNQPTPPNSGADSGIPSAHSSEDDLPNSTAAMQRHHIVGSNTSIVKTEPMTAWPGIEDKNSDNKSPCDHGTGRNVLGLGNMNALKESGTTNYDADVEEGWPHMSRVVLEPRRTKWKGLAFHMKRRAKLLASDEGVNFKNHGIPKPPQ